MKLHSRATIAGKILLDFRAEGITVCIELTPEEAQQFDAHEYRKAIEEAREICAIRDNDKCPCFHVDGVHSKKNCVHYAGLCNCSGIGQ